MGILTRSSLRLFFTLALVAMVMLSGCGKKQNAPDKAAVFYWKIQSQAPEINPDYTSLKGFCKKINTMSKGRLVITPYPAGVITRGEGIFDGVKERKTEMGLGWPNWWIGKDPAWNMIASGPFEFMTVENSMLYFYEDEGMALANELSKPHGILWRPAWWDGMEFGIFTNFPAFGLDDLKGKKIRIGPGLPQETLTEASGCFTVPIVPEEIYDALKQGTIDGVEWTVPSANWPMRFHEVCTHGLVPAVWQPAVLGDFLINEQAYNELPDDLKAMLEVAMREFAIDTTLHGKRLDMETLDKYRKYGLTITVWSQNDLKRWKTASQKVYARHCAQSPSFKRIYESKMRFKQRYKQYLKTHGPYEDWMKQSFTW